MGSIDNLKFLVDVGVSKKVEDWLRNHGYDVKCVRDMNPRMPDMEILKIAASDNRMVITMDNDFGELVYNSGLAHTGVLLLRLEDASVDEKVKVIQGILRDHSEKITNCFCVYKDGKLRVRRQAH